MNKAEKEVAKKTLDDEKQMLADIKKVYEDARKETRKNIEALASRSDLQNAQSIVYQMKYQVAIDKQIGGILDKLNKNQYETVEAYLKDCYNNGFVGSMYALKSKGIPLAVPVNQKQVVRAINNDAKLVVPFYKRLGENVNRMKSDIKQYVSRSVIQGKTWFDIADGVANGMNSPFTKSYNLATRIARTEGHKVQEQATFDSMLEAKDAGADVVKQWDATLDDRTREEHAEADGQIREIDEPFDVGGEQIMMPGEGSAENCINCRCHMLTRARWSLDESELAELQDRASFFGLDKTKDFNDYMTKYLNLPQGANTQSVSVPVKSVGDAKSFGQLEHYMKQTYNVDMTDDVKKLDFKAVAESTKGIETVLDEFPQAKGSFTGMYTSKHGVMSVGYTGNVSFNPSFYHKYSVVDNAMSSVARGFHPANNSVLTTGSHEAGHILELALLDKKGLDPIMKVLAYNDCSEAKRVVSEACKAAKKTPEGKGKRVAQLISDVSGYAQQNRSECLAECVADYVANGKNSSILSREVWKILKRELG